MAPKESDYCRVRLQFLVDIAVSEAVRDLAQAMRQTPSWMAAELLEATLEDRKSVIVWLNQRVLMRAVQVVKGRIKNTGETVYLQTMVRPDCAMEIEGMAERLNQSTSKLGSFLLECAVNDHDWIIRAVTAMRDRVEVASRALGKRRRLAR